jgi:hypothetical protein
MLSQWRIITQMQSIKLFVCSRLYCSAKVKRRIGRNVGSQLTRNAELFEDGVLWGTERLCSATEHPNDGPAEKKQKRVSIF